MSESSTPPQPPKRLPKERSSSRFPKIMLVVTILVFIAIFLVQRVFFFEIEEMTGIGKDIMNVAMMLLLLLTFVSWMITIAFLNRWKVKTRMIGILALLAIPAAIFVLNPVMGGDVGILRFEPIWMSKAKLNEVEKSGRVDLSVESPFDFPRFLGPEQDVQAARGIHLNPEEFSSAKMVWKHPVGEGWSGFTARNGFAVTMEQRDEFECVTCYNVKTGKLEWIYKHQARHQDQMNLGRVGPRSTPTIHNGMVYSVGATGHFVCLNGSDGTVVWKHDLNSILGIELAEGKDRSGKIIEWEGNTDLTWGRAGSPLIVDNLVVVPGGGPKDKAVTLLAFDKSSGAPVWQGGNEMIAYGSPILATVSARRQILLVGERKAMGFDPSDGKMIWSHPRPGASNGMANCSQVTVVSDSYILTSKGYPDGGGELIALEISEDKLIPESIWSSSRVLKTKFTNPVIFDGHAYSISNGFLECTSLADGKRIWKHRKRLENGQILKVGNYILTHSESGNVMDPRSTIHLVDPDPSEYKELGAFRTIKGTCWNTICVYDKYLIVRSEKEAACFELPTSTSAF